MGLTDRLVALVTRDKLVYDELVNEPEDITPDKYDGSDGDDNAVEDYRDGA